MGKRAHRRRRRDAATRIEHRRARVAMVEADREQFELERSAFFTMLPFGHIHRPAPASSRTVQS